MGTGHNRYIAAEIGIGRRARIFAAHSDPNRLRIVELLAERGEMSGSELAEGLGISLVLYSHQWKTLVEAGLIKRRKQGQTGYCSLDRDLLRECAGSLIR